MPGLHQLVLAERPVASAISDNDNLQALQLIVLARYLLVVPNPSPVSQHALTSDIGLHPRGVR